MINWRKLSNGNYVGRKGKWYVFIYRRPHGKWCCEISCDKRIVFIEGFFATSLPTTKIAKQWAFDKLKNI